MGIPLGILPHVREQNKCSYFPRPGQSQHRGCWESNPAPGSTPSSHADPGRLEFSLPLEEPGCAHCPWSNPRYSAAPLQAISSLWVVPYPQAILKFHRPSCLDYRARHGLPVILSLSNFCLCINLIALEKLACGHMWTVFIRNNIKLYL